MANTVSAPLIVKNEEKNIGRLLDVLCSGLEEVIIVDTGSTDSTVEIIKQKQQQHSNLILDHFEWIDDFSAARNFAFSKATKDWVLFIDGDDYIDPTKLAEFKTVLDDPTVDCWMMEYIYARLPDGSPSISLTRERFLRRSCRPTWVGAIHETIAIWNLRQKYWPELKFIHNKSEKTQIDYGRNLRILEKEYQKNPNDPRTAYYYGKELFDHVDPRGVEVLEKYVNMPSVYWDDAVNARARIGRAYISQGKYREACRQAEEIYHLDNTRRRAEGYWILGRVEQLLRNYSIAIKWYEMCLMEPPPEPRVLSMEFYTWNPIRRMAECYQSLGKYRPMWECARKVEALLPGDPDTQRWIKSLYYKLPPVNGQIILEEGPATRTDSHIVGDSALYLDPQGWAFEDNTIDGYIGQWQPEVVRILKPGGFFQNKGNKRPVVGMNRAAIDTAEIWFKTSGKPIYISWGDTAFGPFRIRIANLYNSIIKSGQAVVTDKHQGDPFISICQRYTGREFPLQILDLCELLPNYTYYGIEHADTVICCSEVLAQDVRMKHPNKRVIVVEDHFEFTAESLLKVAG